jgi:hypothetical protein
MRYATAFIAAVCYHLAEPIAGLGIALPPGSARR